jgi:hypothetical protein
MKRIRQRLPLIVAIAVSAAGAAMAADPPKEGTYDITACWSGVESRVEFSKTHAAFSYEMTGTTRSATPGGMFDKITFRCVGMNHAFGDKVGGTTVCEGVDKDGHKYLSYFSNQGGKIVREEVSGTGKYEGLVRTASVQTLGPFPAIKPGTFQNCNRQTGTYKLK